MTKDELVAKIEKEINHARLNGHYIQGSLGAEIPAVRIDYLLAALDEEPEVIFDAEEAELLTVVSFNITGDRPRRVTATKVAQDSWFLTDARYDDEVFEFSNSELTHSIQNSGDFDPIVSRVRTK